MATIINTNVLSHVSPHLNSYHRSPTDVASPDKFNYPQRKTNPLRIKDRKYISAVLTASTSPSSPGTTLYDVLAVPHSVGTMELKKAYREKARVYHPDVCPPGEREESCKMFLLVQEAYETLSDPLLRADYDYNLFISPFMGLESGNEGEKKTWAEQLGSLRTRSMTRRESWGGRMRRLREEAATHEMS